MTIRFIFCVLFTFLTLIFSLILFKPILFTPANSVVSNLKIFDFILEDPALWHNFKILYIITLLFDAIVISNIIYSKFLSNIFISTNHTQEKAPNQNELNLLIGKSGKGEPIYIPEKSLYQNMLITGGIGTGKTASAMYPFTKQLIKYKCNSPQEKLGFLILDVKGNYYSKVKEFAAQYNRQNDVIVIELNGKYTYNPLDKPNLKASILANRIKTILLLFSPNNSESYWLDKSEQVIENFRRAT